MPKNERKTFNTSGNERRKKNLLFIISTDLSFQKRRALLREQKNRMETKRKNEKKRFSYYTVTLLPNTFSYSEFSIIFPVPLVFLYCNLFPTLISVWSGGEKMKKTPVQPISYVYNEKAGFHLQQSTRAKKKEIKTHKWKIRAKIYIQEQAKHSYGTRESIYHLLQTWLLTQHSAGLWWLCSLQLCHTRFTS